MNRRDKERYLTRDQVLHIKPLLMAGVARVAHRLANTSANYDGADHDQAIVAQVVRAFDMDIREQVRSILSVATRKYIPPKLYKHLPG